MSVSELIAILSELPPDARVGFNGELLISESEYKFNIKCYGCIPFYADGFKIKVEGMQVSICLDFDDLPF